MPSPGLTPEQAVQVQLEALARNDEPWTNHGIQTAYEFAEDAGGMEMSRWARVGCCFCYLGARP
jgi:hypothetical protein